MLTGMAGMVAAAGAAAVLSPPAQALVAGPATVVTYTALRTAPAWTGTWLAGLAAGTAVQLTGAQSSGWVEATWSGRRGWVHSTMLRQKTVSAPAPVSGTWLQAKVSTPLRRSPSPSGQVRRTLAAGAGLKATGNVSGAYTGVVFGTMVGWVATADLRPLPVPVTQFYQRHTHGGLSSYYHVYADGIDWSKPVGIAWYFDGDQSYRDQLIVGKPETGQMKAMGAEANRRNMVMVGVESPDYTANGGITWWINRSANGEFFRALATGLQAKYRQISLYRQWMIGWSGGAEFITLHLMATKQRTWMRGGGATIIGGGGDPHIPVETTSSTYRSMRARWKVAADDDYTASTSGWSAYQAAMDGEQEYRTWWHFRDTAVDVFPAGQGAHFSYNHVALMAADMEAAGIRRLR